MNKAIKICRDLHDQMGKYTIHHAMLTHFFFSFPIFLFNLTIQITKITTDIKIIIRRTERTATITMRLLSLSSLASSTNSPATNSSHTYTTQCTMCIITGTFNLCMYLYSFNSKIKSIAGIIISYLLCTLYQLVSHKQLSNAYMHIRR